MSKALKIFIYIGLAIVAVILIAAVAYMVWSRPNRLSETECREIVTQAWEHSQTGYLSGQRMLEYRLGARTYRTRADFENYNQYPVLRTLIRNLFPQSELDDSFLDRLEIRHMGRGRVVGHTVEKIRLTPRDYEGGSIELWIHPELD